MGALISIMLGLCAPPPLGCYFLCYLGWRSSMRLRHHLAVTAVVAALAVPASAAVPPQVMNKTITISYTVSGENKNSEGREHGFSARLSRIIYVSSSGRLFVRCRTAAGKFSRGADVAPGEGHANFSFQGSRLVGIVPFVEGARQVTVTFDASFSSCTASIIEGHSAGGVIRWIGSDGEMYEVISATTSPPSCTIQSGNAFAR
jgi:hypothetical protein